MTPLEKSADFALTYSLQTKTWAPLKALWKSHPELILNRACFHSINNIIYRYLKVDSPPDDFMSALKNSYIADNLWEQNHAQLIAALVASLKAEDIHPLLFKGTALAYTHYTHPSIRVRGDTDILVTEKEYEPTKDILLSMGFTTAKIAGTFYSVIEQEFVLIDDMGLEHHIDLHREVSSCPYVAKSLTHEELAQNAIGSKISGQPIKVVGNIDALLIACFHHHKSLTTYDHADIDNPLSAYILIWVYDIHLLSYALKPHDWDQLINQASRFGMAASCYVGLTLAKTFFNSDIPYETISKLHAEGRDTKVDKYLKAGDLDRVVMSISSQHGIKNTLGYLSEAIFPNKSYMRERYSDVKPPWLVYLYARRTLNRVIRYMKQR